MQQIYTDLRGVCAAMNDESQPDTRIPLAIERTDMAIFRTSLALDRTTLAWIRTTLTMATFGLGMIGFFRTLRQQAETLRPFDFIRVRSILVLHWSFWESSPHFWWQYRTYLEYESSNAVKSHRLHCGR